MAQPARAVPENVPGDLFVDDTCIACDTCRRIAPVTFGGTEDDRSFVRLQPRTPEERRRALMALVACPTASIGAHDRTGVGEASRAFPAQVAPGVLDCGYAAEASFGAASGRANRGESTSTFPSWRRSSQLAAPKEASAA